MKLKVNLIGVVRAWRLWRLRRVRGNAETRAERRRMEQAYRKASGKCPK